jgi:hypothetical protein
MGSHRRGTAPRPVQAPAATEPPAAPEGPATVPLAAHPASGGATVPVLAAQLAAAGITAPRPVPHHARPQPPQRPLSRPDMVVVPHGPARVPDTFLADARNAGEGGLPVFSALLGQRGWSGLHVTGIPAPADLTPIAGGDWVGAVVEIRQACITACEKNAAALALAGDSVRRDLDAISAWVRGLQPSFAMHQAAGDET